MDSASATDRRSFLMTGAIVAAPLAVAVPVLTPALAEDVSRAKLARLEDERALEALHRQFLRHVGGQGDCAVFVAPSGAVTLEDGLRAIADDPGDDGMLTLSPDGRTAASRRKVTVTFDSQFTGHSTLEQMARFQGHGSHRHSASRVMTADYLKTPDGWRIARLTLA